MSDLTIPRGSVEYVTATVTADVALTDATTVRLALTRRGEDHDWIDAAWTGAEGTTRACRTSNPVTFDTDTIPGDLVDVFIQLTDSTEIPIIEAGTIKIT